jgi:hypothetical protein
MVNEPCLLAAALHGNQCMLDETTFTGSRVTVVLGVSDQPHSCSFILSFKMEYNILLINIFSFISNSLALIFLYICPLGPTYIFYPSPPPPPPPNRSSSLLSLIPPPPHPAE